MGLSSPQGIILNIEGRILNIENIANKKIKIKNKWLIKKKLKFK